MKLDQLPKRRASTAQPRIGGPGIGRVWRQLLAGLQPPPFFQQCRLFLMLRRALPFQFDPSKRETLACVLLCILQRQNSRTFACKAGGPVSQHNQGGGEFEGFLDLEEIAARLFAGEE